MVMHQAVNLKNVGSNPTLSAISRSTIMVNPLDFKSGNMGSNPIFYSK